MTVFLTFWRDHNSSFWRPRSLPPSAKLLWVCTAVSPLTPPPFAPQDYLWAEVWKNGKKTRKNNNSKDKQGVFSSFLSAGKPHLLSSSREREWSSWAALSSRTPLPSFKLHWVQATGSQREERTLVVYLLINNTLSSPGFFITNQEKLAFPKDRSFTSWVTEGFVFACVCFLTFKVKFLL